MAETASNEITHAFETTFRAHLRQYLDDPDVARLSFFYEPEDIKGDKCPALGIFDDGGTERERTLRGLDESGVPQAGCVFTEYKIDLQIYIKGGSGRTGGGFHRDDSLEVMNYWRDAGKACLEEHWDLGGLAADVEVKSDEPSLAFKEQSLTLRSGVVRCEVLAYRRQGATTLIGG